MGYETCPRKNDVDAYIREHKIQELLHNMTAILIFDRPDNPKRYLVEKLKLLRDSSQGQGEPPYLFTRENAESIFNMLDPCEKAVLTTERYYHAMETMGLTKYSRTPPGYEDDAIQRDVFLQEATNGLRQLASTYRQS